MKRSVQKSWRPTRRGGAETREGLQGEALGLGFKNSRQHGDRFSDFLTSELGDDRLRTDARNVLIRLCSAEHFASVLSTSGHRGRAGP